MFTFAGKTFYRKFNTELERFKCLASVWRRKESDNINRTML